MMDYDSGRGRLFWGDFMVYDSRVFDGGSWITTQRGTDTMRGPYGLRLERRYLNNYDSGAHFVDYDLCVFVCVCEREDSKGDFMDCNSRGNLWITTRQGVPHGLQIWADFMDYDSWGVFYGLQYFVMQFQAKKILQKWRHIYFAQTRGQISLPPRFCI